MVAFRSLLPSSEGPVSQVRLCDCGLTPWHSNRGRSPTEHISASRFHFLNPVQSTQGAALGHERRGRLMVVGKFRGILTGCFPTSFTPWHTCERDK